MKVDAKYSSLVRVALVLSACFVLCPMGVFAETTFQPIVRVNDTDLSGQWYPSIAVDANGVVYAAWADSRDGGSSIYFAKSTDDGVTFERNVRVSDPASSITLCNRPSVTVDTYGNIFVVWDRNQRGSFDFDIYLAKSIDDGISFGTDVRVDDGVRQTKQLYSSIAVDRDGNVYVAWQDNRNGGYGNIYCAKSTDGGASFLPSVRVSDTGTFGGGESWPAIAADPNGNVYVAWQDNREGASYNTYCARSTDYGGSFSSDVRVDEAGTTTGWSDKPSVALDQSNNIYIAWQDNRNADGYDFDIYLAKSTDGGVNVRVNDVNSKGQFRPSMALDPSGNIYIAWQDNRNGGYSDYNVYFTKSTDGGATFEADVRVDSASLTSIHQDNPALAVDAGGNVYIVWDDGRNAIYCAKGTDSAPDYNSIVINEFLPNPQGNNDEWVEFYNRGALSVDISDCWVDNIIGDGRSPIEIPVGTTINPGEFYSLTVYSGDGYLNNDGDTVNFLKPDGTTLIDSKSYGSVTSKSGFSIYRFADGESWAEDMDDTPTRDAANNGPEPPVVITVAPNTASLTVGGTRQFNAFGGTAPYTWASSNNAVGTIDNSGLFSAVGPGICTVTATDDDGIEGTSGTITVTTEPGVLNIDALNPPYYEDDSGLNPNPTLLRKAASVPRDTNILLRIEASGSGVNRDSLYLSVEAEDIIVDGVAQAGKDVFIRGNLNNYVVRYDPEEDFKYEQLVSVHVTAQDSAGNNLDYTYSFIVEMMILGPNTKVNTDRAGASRDNSCIAVDNSGKNIYIVWEEHNGTDYDIYLTKSVNRGLTFGSDIRVNSSPAGTNQRYPVITVTPTGDVFMAWQDDQDLNLGWDICVAKSTDGGESFLQHKYDYAFDHTQPSIAALNNNQGYLACTASNALGSAIYFASSTPDANDEWYAYENLTQISNLAAAAGADPSLAIDADGDVYIAWKDQSGGIFHDNNRSGSFGTDVRVDGGSQASGADSPSIDVRPNGKNIYIAWQATTGSDQDIFFAKSTDWEANFSSAVGVIDDTTNRAQKEPSLAIDSSGDVYIVWQDLRNAPDEGDIYLVGSVDKGDSFNTNLLINDDSGSAVQKSPSLALDGSGKHVNICWTDSRNGTTDIYFAKNSVINIIKFLLVNYASGGRVTVDDATNDFYGAEVEIPAGALEADTTITIAEIDNPPLFTPPQDHYVIAVPLAFGPGGTEFKEPVTIRIPYTQEDLINAGITEPDYSLSICYFDPVTDSWIEIPDCVTYPTYVEGTVEHFSFFGIIGSFFSGGNGGGGSSGGAGGATGSTVGAAEAASAATGCFIATACFETPMAEEVKVLSEFRDRYLLTNSLGKKFVSLYYSLSPPVADYIAGKEGLRAVVRTLLTPFIWLSKAVVAQPIAEDIGPSEPSSPEISADRDTTQLRLLGTVMGSPALAYIKDLTRSRLAKYKVGDIISGAKIVNIQRGKVTLEQDGRREILFLAGGREEPITKISPTEMIVSKRGVLNEIAESINGSKTLARVWPHLDFATGRFCGFKVEGIEQGSIVEDAGLQNGDIIKVVNGQGLDSPQKAIQVFRKVRNQSQIAVELLRKNQQIRLSYEIKD